MPKEKKQDLNNNLDQDMIENIKNYGNKIETIEDYREAIIQTIGYHLGSIGVTGFLTMIREIFQNSCDEANKEDSPCNAVFVQYDERTKEVIIEDNGRGIPYGNMIRIFTTAYTSSNYTKKEGEFSAGVNGSGGKIVAAISKEFDIESYILGKGKKVELRYGKPISDKEKDIPNKNGRQGTTIRFIPDENVLGPLDLNCEQVHNLIYSIFSLMKVGTTIAFRGIDSSGNIVVDKSLTNKDGIITDLILKTTSPLVTPIVFGRTTGTIKADIAFTYDANDMSSIEDVSCFANFCVNTGGKHLDGFIDGLTTYFRNYMNKIYLNNNKKLTVVNNDIKTGLKGIVTVSVLNPIFNSQAKEVLTNVEVFSFVKNLTMSYLEQWTKENPNEVQKLCKYFKDIADIRSKSDESKIKLSSSYKTSLLTGMPSKYVKPSGNRNLEFFIVEGDSAMGSAKNSRDTDNQGIFPIRGKLPNAFTTTKAKLLINKEIASIITIIGGGYGKSFDISRVKWEKVICMAD